MQEQLVQWYFSKDNAQLGPVSASDRGAAAAGLVMGYLSVVVIVCLAFVFLFAFYRAV